MFNPFYQVQGIASDAIYSLSLCPSLNSVIAEFKKGGKYLYQGVDGDDICDALFDLKSLGQFVNDSCKVDGVPCHRVVG